MLQPAFLALALASTPAAPACDPPRGDEIAIRTVRFYRADDRQTRVWAFVDIPRSTAMVARAGRGDPGYLMTVRVRDATGYTLHKESWRKQPSRGSRATSMEMLHFAVAPGAYRVEVEVSDGRTARTRRAAVDLTGYAADPGASDLVLAPRMRIDPNLTAPVAAGEFRHGSTVITPAAPLRLSPIRARAYYLLEVYLPAGVGADGTMEAIVADRGGRTLVRTPPVAVSVEPGGGVLRGQVNLEGLPPGRYQMRVRVRLGERELERAGELLMDLTEPAHPDRPDVVARRLAEQ